MILLLKKKDMEFNINLKKKCQYNFFCLEKWYKC